MTDAANLDPLIHSLLPEDRNEVVTLQVDLDTWRILKKALKTSLSDRGIVMGDDEASLITRFMLEQIETSGLRTVPGKADITNAAGHQAGS
ncbi:hypothetical protein QN219_00955 [Sinorhizobium sp. 7-81]|uniref:hypothetical protein n=1 Tax=Sinorhizobium sp. 8-89 TaxID=3049089 RepID=UPI0024C44238|nr:hypothetical protein [Sinorhizobium sp. 8-89]MDK1488632.1 hypothetical protein [Sinorhizobium sp. 8-89]